jgi:mannose-6-phosphate isomerase-like protein (cupin superfamily)
VKPTTALLFLLVPLLLLGAGWTALAVAGGPPPRAVLDARLGDERLTLPLDVLPERVALAAGQAFRTAELGRDAHASHHVVAIRDGEVPHRHDRHDLLVVMLRGHGHMRLGAETRAVGEGSILYVPRATVHAFSNTSDEPAIAYAIYTPPFDGKDRVPIE